MAAFSTIGIILMVCAGILFAYQVMSAFLGMGTSDDFLYENIRLEEVVGESTLNWIDSISSHIYSRLCRDRDIDATDCFVAVRCDFSFFNSHV